MFVHSVEATAVTGEFFNHVVVAATATGCYVTDHISSIGIVATVFPTVFALSLSLLLLLKFVSVICMLQLGQLDVRGANVLYTIVAQTILV